MELAVFRSFHAIWEAHRDAQLILVDMPIGLPGGKVKTRAADSLARKLLGKRGSSVFTPGVRSLLVCRTYEEACRENRKVTGKKITLQYWNLIPKIADVDSFLTTTPDAIGRVLESHPELCFEKASIKSINYGKKTADGIGERLEILRKYFPDSQEVYTRVLKQYRRKDVARDDIVDAMILAVTARESRGAMRSLPDPLEMDERNLPMAIWYYDFEREL